MTLWYPPQTGLIILTVASSSLWPIMRGLKLSFELEINYSIQWARVILWAELAELGDGQFLWGVTDKEEEGIHQYYYYFTY